MTQPQAAPPAPPKKKTSALAIVALVLSLVICFAPLSLLGTILGIVALVRIGSRPELGGKGLAIASIPLGVISIAVTGIFAAIAIPNFIAFQAMSKMTEAKSDLKALYVAERSYQAEHGTFGADMSAIGFEPERGNRYAYFLGESGVVEKRDQPRSAPVEHAVIIDADTARHPSLASLTTLGESGCPVSLKRADGGAPLTVGVSGIGPDQAVVAVAAGNLDSDSAYDCWSIASVARLGPNGERIGPGVPFHEQDDAHHP